MLAKIIVVLTLPIAKARGFLGRCFQRSRVYQAIPVCPTVQNLIVIQPISICF